MLKWSRIGEEYTLRPLHSFFLFDTTDASRHIDKMLQEEASMMCFYIKMPSTFFSFSVYLGWSHGFLPYLVNKKWGRLSGGFWSINSSNSKFQILLRNSYRKAFGNLPDFAKCRYPSEGRQAPTSSRSSFLMCCLYKMKVIYQKKINPCIEDIPMTLSF